MIMQFIVVALFLITVIIDFCTKNVTEYTIITLGVIIIWSVVMIMGVFYK